MGPNFIVVTPPVLNDDLGLQPIAEPFHDQAFIPELAVETFIGVVLSRLAWVAQHRFQFFILAQRSNARLTNSGPFSLRK